MEQIASLTPHQKAEAAKIATELERRQYQERLRYFKPIRATDPNPNFPDYPCNDQYGFLMSPAKVRAAFGGNRSCKTESGAVDTAWFCMGIHPVRSQHRKPPVYGRVCAPKYEKNCKGVILKKYKQLIPHCDLYGGSWLSAWSEGSKTLTFANGSQITFLSGEMDINTYGGDELDFFWIDEHLQENKFLENMARIVDRNGYGLLTMTFEEGQTWELDFIQNPPEIHGVPMTVDYWTYTIFGNPYLSKEGVETFEASLKDPMLRRAKLLGEAVALGGSVIPQWNPAVSIVPDRKLHANAVRIFMIDCHPKVPAAAMWAAWEPDDIFEYKLVVYRTIKKLLTVPEWKKIIMNESAGERIEYWYGDETEGESEVVSMRGTKSILAQFKDMPNPFDIIQVKKPKGSYYGGIFKLRDWFLVDPANQKSRIEIFESCKFKPEYINGKPAYCLPDELDRFKFKKEQSADEETLREKVAKVNDHLIDDLRYIVYMGPLIQETGGGSQIVLPKGRRHNKYTGMTG